MSEVWQVNKRMVAAAAADHNKKTGDQKSQSTNSDNDPLSRLRLKETSSEGIIPAALIKVEVEVSDCEEEEVDERQSQEPGRTYSATQRPLKPILLRKCVIKDPLRADGGEKAEEVDDQKPDEKKESEGLNAGAFCCAICYEKAVLGGC